MQPLSTRRRRRINQSGVVRTRFVIALFVASCLLAALRVEQLRFKEYRKSVGEAQCAAIQKQLASSIFEYSQDYDGRFPSGLSSAHAGVGWAGSLMPYANTPGAFRCSADFRRHQHGLYPVSYALNRNAAAHRIADATDCGKTILLFEATGPMIALTEPQEGARDHADVFSASGNGLDGGLACTLDSFHGHANYETGVLGGRTRYDPTEFPERRLRHEDSAVYTFLDGHVAVLAPEQVSSGHNAADPASLQTDDVLMQAAGAQTTDYRATFSVR